MYIIIGDRIGRPIAGLLERIGFQRELRFTTKKYFWQLSRFAPKASAFWTDTLIVKARKASVTFGAERMAAQ